MEDLDRQPPPCSDVTDLRLPNVSDDRAVLEIRTRFLQRAGFTVVQASTAADALRLAAAQPPDGVLVDFRSAEGDASALSDALKRDSITKDIPLICCGPAAGSRDASVNSGGRLWDAKFPDRMDPDLLIDMVLALTRAARAGRRLIARPATGDIPFSKVLDVLPEPCYLLDRNFQCRYVNSEGHRLKGTASQAGGREIFGRTAAILPILT